MSTRKTKSKSPNQHKPGVYISPSPRRSSNSSTILALMHPSRHPSQYSVLAKKIAEEKRDIEQRSKRNKLIEQQDELQNANWRDVNPMKRSTTIRKDLNKLTGGRKRKGTKKKRRNKTKKRAIKNQRK